MITKEQLIEIFNKCEELYLIKYQAQPNCIEILGDGTLQGSHEFSLCRGGWEKEVNEITLDELYDDLDNIRKLRLEKELQERFENERILNEKKILTEKYAKEKRKAEYLKLKQEFENEL